MENLFQYLEQNSIYIVLLISLIIWLGIFVFIFKLDRKVKKLEERSNL